MTTKLIKCHPNTCELALFESDAKYWVGSYSPHLSHQNSEPPYIFLDGYWNTEKEGVQYLHRLNGTEF